MIVDRPARTSSVPDMMESTEVMHEARKIFCLDLFSMFNKTGSCSNLYFCLVMKITSYKNKGFAY